MLLSMDVGSLWNYIYWPTLASFVTSGSFVGHPETQMGGEGGTATNIVFGIKVWVYVGISARQLPIPVLQHANLESDFMAGGREGPLWTPRLYKLHSQCPIRVHLFDWNSTFALIRTSAGPIHIHINKKETEEMILLEWIEMTHCVPRMMRGKDSGSCEVNPIHWMQRKAVCGAGSLWTCHVLSPWTGWPCGVWTKGFGCHVLRDLAAQLWREMMPGGGRTHLWW